MRNEAIEWLMIVFWAALWLLVWGAKWMAQRSRITGADEIGRVLRKLPREIGDKALTNALRAGASVIRKDAKARAPVGTGPTGKHGRLKDNIRVSKIKTKIGGAAVAVHTGKAFWGQFIEFGTRFAPAHPFMRPAFDSNAQEALDVIGKRLGNNIEKAAEKLAGSFAKSGLKAKRRRRR